MTTSTENSPIYFQVLKGWMATHQGRMPGVVPTPGEPEDHPVVDTPYMDDVAKNGISLGSQPWTHPSAGPARRRDSHLDGPPR
jgi:hypothetical protein